MKVFIVVLALVAMVVADHHEGHHEGHEGHHEGHEGHHTYVVKTHDDLVSYRRKCIAEKNVPAEHVEKYKKWEFPDDEITHCYMKCIFEEFGLYDETHGFDVKKIHHQLVGNDGPVDHDNETHAKIEHCAEKSKEGSDACSKAYLGGICFFKENLNLVQRSVAAH